MLKMTNRFEHVDVGSFTVENFTPELIGDLASLVGMDAIEEFGNLLREKRPDLFFPFISRVAKFYFDQEQNNERTGSTW